MSNYEIWYDGKCRKTTEIHIDYSDVFTEIGCFQGTFSLQVRDDVKPYKALPSCVAYALQKH